MTTRSTENCIPHFLLFLSVSLYKTHFMFLPRSFPLLWLSLYSFRYLLFHSILPKFLSSFHGINQFIEPTIWWDQPVKRKFLGWANQFSRTRCRLAAKWGQRENSWKNVKKTKKMEKMWFMRFDTVDINDFFLTGIKFTANYFLFFIFLSSDLKKLFWIVTSTLWLC